MQKQFVSADSNADGEQVKEPARNESLRPRIVLAVESIARNPINAIQTRASALSLARKHTDQRIDRTERAVPL